MSRITLYQLLHKAVVLILVSTWTGSHVYSQETASANGDPELAVGQEWSVKVSLAADLRVIIGRIEPWRDKVVVHVSVVNIPPSVHVGDIWISEIAHMPFERSALVHSLGRLVATGTRPSRDFDAGYKEWKEKNGGIYLVSLAVLLNGKER